MPAADSPALSLQAALQTVNHALRFEDSLRSRTEGLTWIVWGLVSAATFLSFEAVGHLYDRGGAFAEQPPPWWASGLWVPWLLVGIATTYALWRSAALSSPDVARGRPRHGVILVIWVGFVTLGWLVAVWVFPHAAVSAYPIMGLGTAWVVLGVGNPYRGTWRGRRVAIGQGVLIFVVGMLVAATFSPHPYDPSGALVGHVGALITGLVPILGGLWQTTRG